MRMAFPRGKDGSFLLQAMILVLLLAFLASMAMSMIMGRASLVTNVVTRQQSLATAQSMESLLDSCLQNVTSSSCNNALMTACGFPLKVNGQMVTASAAWDAASSFCRVTARAN